MTKSLTINKLFEWLNKISIKSDNYTNDLIAKSLAILISKFVWMT